MLNNMQERNNKNALLLNSALNTHFISCCLFFGGKPTKTIFPHFKTSNNYDPVLQKLA
jgi:hypothetical protein